MENELKVIKGKTEQSIIEEVMNAMKDFRYTPDIEGLNYEYMCRYPHFEIPEGFKAPKFDTFSGVENPLTHLRAYCYQLIGVGKMRIFLYDSLVDVWKEKLWNGLFQRNQALAKFSHLR